MLEYIKFFIIFFKIGLFTIGGGLASIPLLQNEMLNRSWLTNGEFADMIAISQSTPGPIGINIATYIGFEKYGVLGSIIATLGMVCPSIIIITIIAKFLKHFNDNKIVKWVFLGIRPAVLGLIGVAAYNIAKISFVNQSNNHNFFNIQLNYKAIILGIILLIGTNLKKQYQPIIYILIAGLFGLILF
jgi:chromate transporter